MKPKYTFLAILSLSLTFYGSALQAQNIYTFAGNGSGAAGYGGDGGYAHSALLQHPSGVATHDYSKVFIADQGNHVIRKVNSQGIITTYAGTDSAGYSGDGGQADSAMLYSPAGIALDAAGNLFIADYYNNVVRRIDVSSGTITTIAGNDTAGYSGDGGAATNARLHYPYGVAVNAAGYIFIADAGNNVIREVTPSGFIQTVAGSGYGAGRGLGAGAYSGDGGPALAAGLDFPTGVATDFLGNLYIADAGNNAIRKVGLSDSISTYVGNGYMNYSGDGGAATAAGLNFPSGIAVDGAGNVYIADQGNNAVRKVDATGKIHTIAGNGTAGYAGDGHPATASLLSAPQGVAVDGSGLIYIADAGNNVVRIVGNYTVNAVSGQGTRNQDNITVYPNPSSGSFTIEIPEGGMAAIAVSDMLGRIVETSNADAGTAHNNKVAVNNIPAGNYVVKVTVGQNIYRQTIVVLGRK